MTFLYLKILYKYKMKTSLLNLGPQHPASHGVLRLILEVQGEYVKNLNSEIGYLHRGTEKLSDYREYLKVLPYFDKLDYVSCIIMEASYTLGIENLLNIENDFNIEKKRNILMELTRIQNHLLAITTNAMDIGAITPFLWSFEIREKLCIIFEEISGARMHTSLIKPSDNKIFLSISILEKIKNLILYLENNLKETEQLLYNNNIWKSHTYNVGLINYNQININSLTGILRRASGLNLDHRKYNPYSLYNSINNINIPYC